MPKKAKSKINPKDYMGMKLPLKGGKPVSAKKQKELNKLVRMCPLGEHRVGPYCVPNKPSDRKVSKTPKSKNKPIHGKPPKK